jgi:hypothetical protein
MKADYGIKCSSYNLQEINHPPLDKEKERNTESIEIKQKDGFRPCVQSRHQLYMWAGTASVAGPSPPHHHHTHPQRWRG